MVIKLVASIKNPIKTYLDLTISDPCKTIVESSKTKKSKRPRKNTNSFSIREHMKRQKEMTSPEVESYQASPHNLRRTYVQDIKASPTTSDWLH